MRVDSASLMIPELPVSERQLAGIQDFNKRVSAAAAQVRTEQLDMEELLQKLGPETRLVDLRKQVDIHRERIHGGIRQLANLGKERQEILVELQDCLKENLAQRGKELDTVRVKTGKALERAGQGAADQPAAAVNPGAAEARFQHLIENATPVREARELAEQAGQDLRTWQQLQRAATEVAQDRLQDLRQVSRGMI